MNIIVEGYPQMYIYLSELNPITPWGGGGLILLAGFLISNNILSVYAMNLKFGDFS